MSKKTNYFNIGLFVIIAIALITTGVIVFGTGVIGRNSELYEAYFDESIQGLSIGSPLKYRGVDIGRVERIDLASQVYHNQLKGDDFVNYGKYVRVVLAVDSDKIAMSPVPGGNRSEGELQLRVRIVAQGITGLSFLDVDFFDPVKHPTLDYPWKPENPCLPSASGMINQFVSNIETFLDNVSKIDFLEIQNNLNTTLDDIGSTFGAFRETIDGLNVEQLSNDLTDLIEQVNVTVSDIRKLTANLDDTVTNANAKISEVQMKEINDKVVAVLTGFGEVSAKMSLLFEPQNDDYITIPELTGEMKTSLKEFRRKLTESNENVKQIAEDFSRFADNMDNLIEDVSAQPSKLFFSDEPAESKVLE
ncbi:MAG: MlaD family protein [Phycisphaerae bacterium]|jgi:ABC-type transporter Mla subunit MlaD